MPSSTGTETYAWLGQLPKMREWLGDRVIQNISTSGYSLINKDFEQTVSVDRNHVLDNVLGQYSMILQQMGFDVAVFPTELVWNTLAAGFTSLCYDGQYFFDTDHPVIQADGSTASVSNVQAGTGNPWFLLDTRRGLYSYPALQSRLAQNTFATWVNAIGHPGLNIPGRRMRMAGRSACNWSGNMVGRRISSPWHAASRCA